MRSSKMNRSLLKKLGKVVEYRGFNKVKFPGVPVVLVPTTAGTGTEATETAFFYG